MCRSVRPVEGVGTPRVVWERRATEQRGPADWLWRNCSCTVRSSTCRVPGTCQALPTHYMQQLAQSLREDIGALPRIQMELLRGPRPSVRFQSEVVLVVSDPETCYVTQMPD